MSQYDQIKFTQWLPQYTTGHPGWAEKCASQGGHKHTNMYYNTGSSFVPTPSRKPTSRLPGPGVATKILAADPVEENAVLIGLCHDAAELDAFKGYFNN